MKRKSPDGKIWWVRKIWPIFWKRCKVCGCDFKFEWGWKAMKLGEIDEYVCLQCASSKQDVLKFCDIPPIALPRAKGNETDLPKKNHRTCETCY